ncbi:MAG TPA: APC family permease [Steroidobacteraceae bacterium]
MGGAGRVEAPGLLRGLTRFDVTALTINSVVGAGVFALPAGLALSSGRWSLAVVCAAFAVVATLALSLAEVASRFDVTGGPQVYAQATFGPLAGFTVGWLFTVSRFASFALIAQVMLDYAAALWPALHDDWPRAVAITLFTAVLTAVNVRGVTRGAWVGNVLTIAKLLPLVAIALAGIWFAGWTNLPTAEPQQPGGLVEGLQLALFACFGFEVIAIVAGEMRDPRRDIAFSILAGLGISCLLYLLLMLASFGILADSASHARPLVSIAEHFLGAAGGTLMAAAAVVSCAGGLAVAILTSPRNMFALAEAQDLPRAFAAVHPQWRTPWVSIVVYAVLSWLVTITGTFRYLLELFVISRMLAYGSTCLALIVLRRREGPAPAPVPGGPVIATLALAACAAIVSTATLTSVRDVAIVIAIGFVIRALVRWRAAQGNSR